MLQAQDAVQAEPLQAQRWLWPKQGLARVPYWAYRSQAIYDLEQQRIYRGPVWNFLCLEAELPVAGSFKVTRVGDMPVVVSRDGDGSLHAFENRCAHRGALLVLENMGTAKDFTCVYHAWRHDLRGNLASVAFRRGVNGQGGMPESFRLEEHGPRKLRIATLGGLVFGTLHPQTPPLAQFIGPQILPRLQRVLRAPLRVLGHYTQMLPNNWKLYFENVKDSYHASLLHLFFATFKITRLSQGGGIIVDESGGNHVSYSLPPQQADDRGDTSYDSLRSKQDDFGLEDPRLLEVVDEFGDGCHVQILSLFPGLVVQAVQNSLAVRQILPHGVDQTQLVWTYFGFEDDDAPMRERRLRHANFIGPAGFISMEDGAVGGFIQRGIAACDSGEASVVEMGGHGTESQSTRATEVSVRGFWKAWRSQMQI